MALFDMIQTTLATVPNPAKERAIREAQHQKRVAFEAMLGNLIPNLDECDGVPCTVRVTNVSPEFQEIANDMANSYDAPDFANLFVGKINSLADLFEMAICMMRVVAGHEDNGAYTAASGSQLTAAGILSSNLCTFRVISADGQVIDDQDGQIAHCFFEMVKALNGNIDTPILAYSMASTVEADGTINEIRSCLKTSGEVENGWLALNGGQTAEPAGESAVLFRYHDRTILAHQVTESGALESAIISSASAYACNSMDASDALNALESNFFMKHGEVAMETPMDKVKKVSMAIEEGLPQTAPEYNPLADLEEIEQTLAGIDQTNPELDPDQPQPDQEMDEATNTVNDMMTSPQDKEVPDDAGMLEQ